MVDIPSWGQLSDDFGHLDPSQLSSRLSPFRAS
jgi:hypothetical protein